MPELHLICMHLRFENCFLSFADHSLHVDTKPRESRDEEDWEQAQMDAAVALRTVAV